MALAWPRWVYRAMRPDLEDVRMPKATREVMSLCPDAHELRCHVLQALAMGSHKPSPFLHFSKSFEIAKAWHALARAGRQEVAREQYIVRLDMQKFVDECGKKGKSIKDFFIDLSDKAAQKEFFTLRPEEYAKHATHLSTLFNWNLLSKAEKDAEVLVKWRGTLPLTLLEVVHSETGCPTGMSVSDMLARNGRTAERVCWDNEQFLSTLQPPQQQTAAAAAGSSRSLSRQQPGPCFLEQHRSRHEGRPRQGRGASRQGAGWLRGVPQGPSRRSRAATGLPATDAGLRNRTAGSE